MIVSIIRPIHAALAFVQFMLGEGIDQQRFPAPMRPYDLTLHNSRD